MHLGKSPTEGSRRWSKLSTCTYTPMYIDSVYVLHNILFFTIMYINTMSYITKTAVLTVMALLGRSLLLHCSV